MLMLRRLFLAGAALAPSAALADTPPTLRDRLLGAWRIVDAETGNVATGASSLWQGNPSPYAGIILYQPNGWMSVNIGAARPKPRPDASFGTISDAEKM